MKKLFTVLFIFIVSYSFAQEGWQYVSAFPTPNPDPNTMWVVDQNTIWVACNYAGGAAKVYKTTNGGTTWLLRAGGLPATMTGYGIFAFDTTTAFVGSGTGTLYKTTNGGYNWTSVLAVSGSFTNGVHMFTSNYGIYQGDPTGLGTPFQFRVTTDGGNTWNLPAGVPTANNASEWGVINAWDWTDSAHVWMGSASAYSSATSARVFRTSTGFYGTWAFATLPGTTSSSGVYYQAIGFIDQNTGIAGSSSGELKKTTDGGATWTAITSPITGSNTIFAINGIKGGSNIFRLSASTVDSTYIYKTTNVGTTWIKEQVPVLAIGFNIQQMQFLTPTMGYAIVSSGAVSSGGIGGFIKYAGPSAINPINTNLPSTFSLSQNYPNPFNPSTKINFALPKAGNVNLVVYNTLGQAVETLVNEQMSAGNYEITFDASKLNSGIYFYKLSANGFSETKRMMLVK